MAKQPDTKELDQKINKLVNDGVDVPVEEAENENEPMYRMMAEDRIAVSKKLGPLWKSRKKASLAKLKNSGELKRWEEAVQYYRNDHHSQKDPHSSDEVGRDIGTRLTTRGKETENIVFANTSSLVPAVYAKNPTVEISADNPEFEEFMKTAERLINALFRIKTAPGINLKPKARRAVINTTLTNEAWMEVGYVEKEMTSDEAIKELETLSKQLMEAKKPAEIKDIEGKLEALESKIDLLSPSSPFAKFKAPHDVLVDTDATMMDECRWIMYRDYVPTEMLKALYGKKDAESDEYMSIFKPSHIMKIDEDDLGNEDSENNFSFLRANDEKTHADYGFDDEYSYKRAQRTEVWYVWDKVVRRVYLFNACDWKWPLWVWDDPYQYPDFFPLVRLNFYDDPDGFYARSETLMFLDQQDAINAINNEVAKVRAYITGKVIYNSNVVKDDTVVENFLAGTEQKSALGVNVPLETDMTKLFVPFVPQSAQFLNTVIFDKGRLLEAIDRVSSVTSVMRGVEYKTNTTNKAIESYESTTQTRLDEKIDAVEEFIGEIGTKLLHVCLRNMSRDTVANILGEKDAMVWEEFRSAFLDQGIKFTATVVGGSTLKPTSAVKKQQAVQISQALGQFASAAPVAILIALKVMERAFDEVVIRDEDWQMIIQSIEQQLQRGQSAPSEDAPAEGQATGEGGEEPSGGELIQQMEKLVDSLPDSAKQFLGQMIAQGTPIREAVGQVVQELQQQQAA